MLILKTSALQMRKDRAKPQGNVVVKSGAELSIDAKGKTVINNGFKVEQGSKILIK